MQDWDLWLNNLVWAGLIAALTVLALNTSAAAREQLSASPTTDIAGWEFRSLNTGRHFLVAPYIWAPSIKGEAGIAPASAKFDYAPEDLASGINAGGMGYIAWNRGRDFFYLEGMGFRYKGRVDAVMNKLVHNDVGAANFGYGRNYCVYSAAPSPCSVLLAPFVGAQYGRFDATIRLNEGGTEGLLLTLQGQPSTLSAHDEWFDVSLGSIAQWRFRENISYYTKIDTAGFKFRGISYWSWVNILHYQLSPRWAVAAGYRFGGFNADPYQRNEVSLTLDAQGPMLGLIYSSP